MDTNSPWVCISLIKVCSNFGATYIIGEIIAKDNSNIAKLLQTFENILSKTAEQNSKVLRTNSPWICVILVCSNGGTNYIIGKLIAKDSLNVEDFMQTFENLLIKNCLTKFLDIAHKIVLGYV